MISEKVDLTENRDFADDMLMFVDEPITMRDFYDRKELMENGNMTLEQYERLKRIESIFGMSRHYNEKIEIFGMKTNCPDDGKHCWKCGKEIRAPWKNYFGLCKECREKQAIDVNGPMERDTGMELFSLK
jgi:hypothetical protein